MSRRDLQEAIQDLVDRGQAKTPDVQPHQPRDGVKPGRAKAAPKPAADTAGIASPLTEPDVTAREYHDTQLVTSADGLFTLPVKPVKKLVMADANGAEVVIEFAAPEDDG